VSAKAIEKLGKKESKIITCHIGNGGSISAILNGHSVDPSMGLTPLEGLVMGTRCGDLDPAAVTFLQESKGWSVKEINNVMNKKSGLAGLSGVSSDMRDIEAACQAGNKQAELACEMFVYRVKKYIGAYAAVLKGVDALVFTGGMGENQVNIRKNICAGLSYLGLEIDEQKNADLRKNGGEGDISKDGSKVRIYVIPTDEEYMIALDTLNIVSKL
jgi:acetate kinase